MDTRCWRYTDSGQAKALSIPPVDYAGNGETQRNGRGTAPAEEHVVEFDDTRGPFPGLKLQLTEPETVLSSDSCEGAAWLSSARAVRCRLKCHNERNPYR